MSTTPNPDEDVPPANPNDGADSDAPENTDKGELEKLDKAAELIAKVAKEGEKSGVAVDAVAEAAYFFRSSKITAPFRLAWEALPAAAQREMAGTDQSAIGEFFMRYFPLLNLRAWFVPGLLIAALAKVGVVKFKLNSDEEKAMASELGENPSEAAKIAHKAKVEEELTNRIVHPYQGVTKVITGPLGAIVGAAQPELAPAVTIAKAGNVIEQARDGYFVQVRERVHALELEAAQQKDAAEAAKVEVKETMENEHDMVAKDLKPQVEIPAANNTDHFAQEHGLQEKAA